ncbi:hypothetical protein [Streptomyces sp. NPDC020951]|uniref:hypothetical protein n=1 Tax=Streptomyces sp. NPDC020951 TaxID=3365104 RepID=UPI0037ACB668
MTSIRPRPVFSRREWERAVLAGDLCASDRAVALVLAHLAGGASRLPAGGPQTPNRLSVLTRVTGAGVRASLTRLQEHGFIDRPDIHAWTSRRIWPVTLTMPTAPAPAPAPAPSPVAAPDSAGAVRGEPAHPSPAAS